MRAQRAQTLANLRSGSLSALEALSAPPSALLGADVYYILMASKGLGRQRVRVIFERTDIWPHKRLEELNERERDLLTRELQK